MGNPNIWEDSPPYISKLESSLSDHVQRVVCTNLSRIENRERREYDGEISLLKDVPAGEFHITDATTPQPILSTEWVGTCIAVAGYDSNKKVWFLAHIVAPEDVAPMLGKIFRELTGYGEWLQLEFSLVWGMNWWEGSEATALEIYRCIGLRSLEWRMVYSALFSPEERLWYFDPTSLLLDTRNGNLYRYPDKSGEGNLPGLYDLVVPK